MAIRITSVQTQNGQEIPDGGSTPRRHLDFIGRVSPSGTVEIKDGRGGKVLGSAQVVEGDPFNVAVNALEAKKYEFVAELQGTSEHSDTWVITVT